MAMQRSVPNPSSIETQHATGGRRGSTTLPRPPDWPPPTPPTPAPRQRIRRRQVIAVVASVLVLVLVVTSLIRSASTAVTTEVRNVRAAAIERARPPTEHAPPSRYALDKMTEALLWVADDEDQLEFVRQDIQRVMRCAPVTWLTETIDLRGSDDLRSFKDRHGRFVERHLPSLGFAIGDAERALGPHRVERMSIAWRCATTF